MQATEFGATRLYSYSAMREARPREMHHPGDIDALTRVLRRAAKDGRRVTIRAAGRSFDDQAMNDDVVVDISSMNRILMIDVEKREITVEPAASWGSIVDATLPHGLVPHILVTTPWATAAGTLSANCVSRSSPRHGHTGDHVRSFELLTVDGDVLQCSRDHEPELFHAVIGGFGYFGVVIRVTFDLLEIGARVRLKTEIERREGLEPYVSLLAERSQTQSGEDAVYSVFSLAEPQRGAVFRSTYTDEPIQKTLFLHQPWSWYRPFAELLFASSRVGNAVCHASYKYVFGNGPFVDDFRGYTFCMEGNERMKAIAGRVGMRVRSIQPSFALPSALALLSFFRDTARLFRKHRVYPSLLDCVYRPSDEFLLSSANGLSGFLTSYIFEGVTHGKWQRLEACLLELNDACHAAGGRIHLVKSVHATRAQLQAMYGHAAADLARIKSRVDPRGVLVNDFFERAFG